MAATISNGSKAPFRLPAKRTLTNDERPLFGLRGMTGKAEEQKFDAWHQTGQQVVICKHTGYTWL